MNSINFSPKILNVMSYKYIKSVFSTPTAWMTRLSLFAVIMMIASTALLAQGDRTITVSDTESLDAAISSGDYDLVYLEPGYYAEYDMTVEPGDPLPIIIGVFDEGGIIPLGACNFVMHRQTACGKNTGLTMRVSTTGNSCPPQPSAPFGWSLTGSPGGGTGQVVGWPFPDLTEYEFNNVTVTLTGNYFFRYDWGTGDFVTGAYTWYAELAASITSQTNVSCNGGDDGSATVTVSVGTAPYDYEWNTNPVQTTQTATDLAAGTYTVTITDFNGCSIDVPVTITEPDVLQVSTSKTDVNCKDGSDGTATANPTGGTYPYFYSWNTTPAQTTQTATGLTAGTYIVTVTDSKGCIETASVTISEPLTGVAVSLASKTDVLCFGDFTGAINVTVTGGTASYTFSWEGPGSFSSSDQNISGLAAGTYTLTVTDANQCTDELVVEITQPAEALSATIPNVTNVTCYDGTDGAAEPFVVGGTSPYDYSWEGPNSFTSTDANISGLIAGTYTLTVTDDNGCATSVFTTITQPPALPTPTANDVSVCYDGAVHTASASFIAPATGIIWYTTEAGTVTTTAPSGTAPGTYTAWAAATDGTCESPGRVLVTLFIDVIPVLSIEPDGFDNDEVFSGGSYSWNLIKDGDVTGTHDATFTWPFVGTHTITYTDYSDELDCPATVTLVITVKPNQIVGQVKYYNAQESPMPSPYMSNYYGMDVPDYFWVVLLAENDWMYIDNYYDPVTDALDLYSYLVDVIDYNEGIFDPFVGTYTPTVEFTKVEEYYKDDPINGHPLLDRDLVYEAAFAFESNVNPDEEYFLFIWDGGFFDEPNPMPDESLGKNWTWNNWGGANATDALLIQHMVVSNNISAFPNMQHVGWPYDVYNVQVADANRSGSLTALDALLTSRRAIGLIQKYPNNKPNFAVAGIFVEEDDFNTNNVFRRGTGPFDYVVPGAFIYAGDMLGAPSYHWSTSAFEHFYGQALNVLPGGTSILGHNYLNIYYDAIGDINASYYPVYGGFKDAPAMELIYEDVLAVNKGEEVTIPVTIDNFAELGALSIGMTYRTDLIEVIATNYGEDFAYFDHEAGTVNIAWASLDGQHFNADDVVALITVRVLANIDAGTRLFELTGFTELADRDAKVIEGVNLKSKAITTDAAQTGAYTASNHPNPFNEQTTISYIMPEAGAVNLIVYNKMGQVVKTLVNENQSAGVHNVTVNSSDLSGPGVYYYKLEVKGESNDFSSTNSMILVRQHII